MATNRVTTPSGDGLGARAAIAGRRSRGAMLIAVIATAVTLAGVQFGRSASSARESTLVERSPADDSVLLVALADRMHGALATADSQYERVLHSSENGAMGAASLAPPARHRYDSLQAVANALDALIDRARRAPLAASYRELSSSPTMRGEGSMSVLADSLERIERRRESLGPSASGSPLYVDLVSAANSVGIAILDVASRRRATIARELTALTAETPANAGSIDTSGPRRARDSLRSAVDATDARLRALRARATARASHDSLARAGEPRAPLLALGFATLLIAVTVLFGVALSRELRHPTLATAREAEEVAGAPVVAIVRQSQQGRRPGALDPFRMLYLGLTATGTRARTVILAGDDPGVAATAAGRLAIAAGADARATLVVDADAENSPAAAYFDERPEPGFTDAVAGVRLWREAATPIGASDGVQIDFVPAGSIRELPAEAETIASAREEFARFRGGFDLSVVVAPTPMALQRVEQVIDTRLVVICLRLAATRLDDARHLAASVRARGGTVHGVLLWDAATPSRAARSTLLARALARAGERSGATEVAGV